VGQVQEGEVKSTWRGVGGKLEGGGRGSANCENLIRVGKVTPRGNQERGAGV
jgi:hypothetical protein